MFSKLAVRLINKAMFVCLQTGYEIKVSVLFNLQILSNLASSSATLDSVVLRKILCFVCSMHQIGQ